jgi:LmbE family N-acetylglucosaminyl deacetylase
LTSVNKIVVFAPHPDDETLGCGGTIIQRLRQGYQVVIVIVTDGSHAYLKMDIQSPTKDELAKIRKKEAIKAIKILGVPQDNLLFWNFEDQSTLENSKEIQEKCEKILSEIQPAEIFFPNKNDTNIDHKELNKIVSRCIKNLNLPADVYLYSISARFGKIGPLFEKILNIFKKNLVFINVTDCLPEKIAALNEYNSQINRFTSEENRDTHAVIGNYRGYLRKREIFIKKPINRD